MTGKSLWQQIKDVVDHDKKIVALQADIDQISKAIVTEQLQAQTLNKRIEDKQRVLFATQKDFQLKDLRFKELNDAEKNKRKHFDAAKGQKEYLALEKEINIISAERTSLEDQLVKLSYAIEELKKDVDSLIAHKDEQLSILDHDIKIKRENQITLETKLAAEEQAREQAVQLIQPEWRVQYERMKHSVEDPIVPVLNGCCGACFYSIPAQDFSRVKKNQIIVCRNCYRFLYYDAVDTTATDTARY